MSASLRDSKWTDCWVQVMETLLRVMEGGRKLHEPEADPQKRKREPHGGQANGREHEVVVLSAVGTRDGGM